MTGPSKPLGMSDFFALEAGEYLERLDALLQQSEAPGADEFVRLARALRGSALMANQQAIAKAAAGVESLARALARRSRARWTARRRRCARTRWRTTRCSTCCARSRGCAASRP